MNRGTRRWSFWAVWHATACALIVLVPVQLWMGRPVWSVDLSHQLMAGALGLAYVVAVSIVALTGTGRMVKASAILAIVLSGFYLALLLLAPEYSRGVLLLATIFCFLFLGAWIGVMRFRFLAVPASGSLLLAVVGVGAVGVGLAPGGPGRSPWRLAEPEAVGFDSSAFRSWAETVHERGTEALLVVRNDRLVHEWYRPGRHPDSTHYTASMQKAIAGGLGLALLVDRDALSLDDPVARFAPEWRGDSQKSRITLRQLGTHSSGLEDAEEGGLTHDRLTGWKGAFWDLDPSRTPIEIALKEVPVVHPPGEAFAYSNTGFAVLSYVLAARLQQMGITGLNDFLRDSLYRPIGLKDGEWRIGYGRPFQTDGLEVWATWGGGSFTPRALARIGRLLLRRGDWEGERVLSPAAVEAVVTYRGIPPPSGANGQAAPGVGWFTNARGLWPRLPRGAFAASGAGARVVLLVVPELDLIIVRLGTEQLAGPEEGLGSWGGVNRYLIEPLMDALPVPPVAWSEEVAGAWFEPTSSIACKGVDSDNWPMTWARDGSMYVAYGDGRGFEPGVEEKLSLGFARVEGEPNDFEGVNIRSPSGEGRGDGPEGPKASGLLEVDGVLYMWVRNMENARLAWSEDEARTWKWGFRFTESFGSPSFLQFGPGYQGASDSYVYVYSQDGPSAYESDDRVILARVHRDSIREREAYEFFAGLDRNGSARWSPEFSERGVLEHRGGSRRIEVVHNPELGRYLMALGFDFDGGWGLFDAPEPWGPWTAVYATPRWDVPETHSYRIPTKWIADEGRSLHLVYSGFDTPAFVSDAFCVRPFRLLPLRTDPDEGATIANSPKILR